MSTAMTTTQNTIHRDTTTIGYSAALIAVIFLAFTAILIRFLSDSYELQPLVLAFWRAAFVPCTVVPVMATLHPALLRIARADLAYLVAHGLILAAFNSLWTISVILSGAAVATVLVYSSAAFTAVLGRLFLRERLDASRVLVIGLCLFGCVCVSGAWSPSIWATTPLATATGVLSGLGYAAYSLMGRAASLRGLNPWTTLVFSFSFATVFLLLTNLVPGDLVPGAATRFADLFALSDAWHGWSLLLLLAAGPTVVGFGLYNISLAHLPASVANLVVTLEPVLTGVLAFLLLGETLTSTQLIGSATIVAGVILLRIQEGLRSYVPLTQT